MPSALLLAPEAPYPISGGGSLRTASLLHYLAQRYTTDAIVFREPGAPDPEAAFAPGLVHRVGVIELPRHGRHFAARAGRNLARLVRARPPLNDRFSGFGDGIAQFLAGRHYELIVVEHFWCAPYCEQAARHAGRMVLDLHNIESLLYRRCAAAEPFPASLVLRCFAAACRRLERRWLPRYDLLLAASETEAALVSGLAPGVRVGCFPNSIPEAPLPAAAEENVLIFSGNFEYQPNISGVRYFRRLVWPLLRERWPGLAWRLVGKNPQGVERYTRGDPRIELRGAVEDPVAELAAARVIVVPLLAGSGTRLKILEAWAAGRAVVSTTVGAEGLPARAGEHLLVADRPQDFAEAVSSLLASREERERLGRAGRRLYEERFTWRQAWRNLEIIGI